MNQCRHLGRWHDAVARLLVAVLLVVSVGPMWHAAGQHEGEFAPLLDLHDCGAHTRQISAHDGAPLPEVVCAVCHLGRHAWSASRLGQGLHHIFAFGSRLGPGPEAAPRSAASLPLPARAPPASLLG